MKTLKFSEQESAENRKSLFGVIWGLSIILYEISDNVQAHFPSSVVISFLALLAAGLLVMKPKKDFAWISLGSLVTIQILTLLPNINNHSTLFAILSVCVMVGFLASKFSVIQNSKTWHSHYEPLIRLAFLIGYGSAAIAKLNSAFFNYQISCANFIAKQTFSWLPFEVPFERFVWLPYLISAIELFIFAGLIFNKTRVWAIVIGGLFHFSLSLNTASAGVAFNPALYSMLIYFLPTSATNYLVVGFRHFNNKLSRFSDGAMNYLFLSFFAFVIIFWRIFAPNQGQQIPCFIVEMIFAVTYLSILIPAALKFRQDSISKPIFTIPSLPAWVLVSILILNSGMPYLGGKTAATFTMYSNLRVEGGESNHFFIPRLPIQTAQDDLVRIENSSNPNLQTFANSRVELTWFSLQQYASLFPRDSLSFTRQGKTYKTSRMENSRALNDLNPFWSWAIGYRIIPEDGSCTW